MHIVVYRQARPWSDPWEDAFAAGLRKHSVAFSEASVLNPVDCDLAVFWGHRRKNLMQRARQTYLCMERGFFRREEFASLGYGGLNGRAFWVLPEGYDESRWKKHGPELLPWRGELQGRWIIMGQVAGDASIEAVDIDAWCRQVKARLATIGIQAEIRKHPLSGGRNNPPIEQDLAEAAAVFTYNSNAGVDAVIAGVPTVAVDRGSMVWDKAQRWIDDSMSPIDEPRYREWWAYELAYKQWTQEEIASGEAWENIQPQCECCYTTKNIAFEPDPFASEIAGDDSPVWQCESCACQRAEDI